jgi:hypothetical protein
VCTESWTRVGCSLEGVCVCVDNPGGWGVVADLWGGYPRGWAGLLVDAAY